MNTFGSDLNKILSAREQAHSAGVVSADVPVIKADTITKTVQEETDQKETDQKDQKETDQKETDQKEIDQKESEV